MMMRNILCATFLFLFLAVLFPFSANAKTSNPPNYYLYLNPSIITSGQSASITWGVNAPEGICSGSGAGFSITNAQNGTKALAPTPTAPTTYWYTIDCSGDGWTGLVTNASLTVNPAPTGTISASPNPCTITAGSSTCSSSISWSTSNTPSATVTINNGSQTFAGGTSGTQTASWIPNGSVLFTLNDSNGNALSSVNVTGVCASGSTWNGSVCAANPPTASLTASPNPVAYNGRSTLTWSSTNATSCSAGGPWSNSGTLSGSGLTNPLTTATTFTFQCTGPGGTSPLQSVTVNVGAAPVNGACASTHYSCTAGTSTNNVDGSTAYTWTCAGSGGGTDASCSEAKLPTSSLSATPATIVSGQSSTLAWSSTNATSCTAAGGFTTGGATSGSASVSPATTSSYQVYCDNSSGRTYSNIATVTVSPPPTVSINAAPSRVVSGGATTISWNASNVNTCTITRNGALWKSLTANSSNVVSGSAPDTITSQTVYVMNCNGSAGATAAATQIVNVVQSFQEF
ncbi:MAG: hypothetical protein ACYCPH_00900 [Minisyncoccota bacterium]